jgi:hypothetical protein
MMFFYDCRLGNPRAILASLQIDCVPIRTLRVLVYRRSLARLSVNAKLTFI